ncbi:aladin protein [Dioscorea alata]|uniref:Aladin protein n=3 Tax=Dioscorea alata TaxID=55571 RepID=A0ACB7V268_DIOAL|nr:aladin protein [Dioscorea alata]KAH7667321.1 aladin protein [Dioscorea alata]KAH7667322.1 aladin protein [Dioscorea alata]
MPGFPHPGSLTICEINRELIIAEKLSDEQAKETYGKILGLVFSPVPFEVDLYPSDSEQIREQQQESSEDARRGGFAGFKAGIFELLIRFFSPNSLNVLTKEDVYGVSWNPHKHCLAFTSGRNQVTIRDYEDSEGKDPCVLTSEFQRDVKALEWRPNSGKTLSVGCTGGICIWSASYPSNAAMVRPGIASSAGGVSRASGVRWTLVDFLRSPDGEQISALCWNPDGRFLASASSGSSSFTIWDVAQGLGTPIRRGLGAISMLKWSPTGDYFFTAKSDGTFYIWETNTWTSEPWSSTGGNVSGAAWDPDGRMILLAFSQSTTLGSIHFASKPPALDAHLLPVELPEIALTGSHGIEKIAWDASGERLALSFQGGDDMYDGLIAVYDIRRAPLISTSLVGFIRGPGEKPKPLAFAFHNKFKQGPLLTVCWSSGWCCTYPLIFRSHILP